MPTEDLALDQGRDLGGRGMHHLAALYGAPAWVKAAGRAELCGDDLPGHMYADPANLLYPTHTKAATWTSAAFFAEHAAAVRPERAATIRERLRKSADFFGIGPDVAAIERRHAEIGKHDDARLPDSAFAYVKRADDGTTVRRLRVANALEVKAAAAWLRQYRDQLTFGERQEIAMRVLEKAAEFGASTGDDEFLNRAAGFGACAPEQAVAAVRQRAVLARAKHAAVAGQLDKLAGELAAEPIQLRNPATAAKLAGLLEQADRTIGVEYGGAIRPPIDVLFAATQKAATAYVAERVELQSGTVYSRDSLAKLALGDVRDNFGDELAEAATRDGLGVDPEKLADVAQTLPRGDSERFDRLAARAGIVPLRKEAAATRRGLTREDILMFAARHKRA